MCDRRFRLSAPRPRLALPIGKAPLTTEWRSDLLDGVLTIKGKWADGSPLLAIPNYARNNRETITTDEQATSPKRSPSGRSGNSMVWIKDDQHSD